jgi:hypothetical protein
MSFFGSNGHVNGGGGGAQAASLVVRLLRRPTLAVLRRYADWVESTSSVEVGGPGAAYAGSAVYLCRKQDVPVVFLHRAHYDDRTLLDPAPTLDPLALFASAAGLLVSRGRETPPDIERAVRAGNGALFVVGKDPRGTHSAALAAALALRTQAPLIALSGEARRALQLPWIAPEMRWPRPRNFIQVSYGPLERLPAGTPEEHVGRVLGLFG